MQRNDNCGKPSALSIPSALAVVGFMFESSLNDSLGHGVVRRFILAER